MKPFGVCSDVHVHNWSAFSTVLDSGINSRLEIILDELIRAAVITKENGGDDLIITGDLFHVRGSITPSVLNPTKDAFNKMLESVSNIYVLTGNHDLESKDSKKITNACESLSEIPGVTVISETLIDMNEGRLLVPWYESSSDLMAEIKARIKEIKSKGGDIADFSLFIHAPMNDVIPGLPDHGIDPTDLADFGFKYVFCGHYHNHKEVRANVFSVGALTHQTWGDVQSKAGSMVVSDLEVEHFESEAPNFVLLNLEDTPSDDDEMAKLVRGNYVKLKVGSATPEEVKELREYLIGLGALAAVIEALPDSKVVARKSSVSGAATLQHSVRDFVKARAKANSDINEASVIAECEDILTRVGSV